MRIYVSELIPCVLEELLSQYGEVLRIPPFERLPKPVCTHADMLLFNCLKTGKTIIPEEYCNANKEIFLSDAFILDQGQYGCEYPLDIRLDALLMGEYLFCLEKYTANIIKQEYKIINVKQGYARCSSLKVNDNALISADSGICKKAKALGMDVLEISPDGIILPGYTYGFIGGASYVNGSDVVFFGDITAHPDYNEINKFLKKYDMNIIYPKELPLCDYGSAVGVDIV